MILVNTLYTVSINTNQRETERERGTLVEGHYVQ